MVYKYAEYAKQQLHIDIAETQTRHIHKWMYYLKTQGKNCYFMKDCKISLNRFFSFLVKIDYIKKNPAETLPRIKIPRSNLNKPLAKEIILKILKSFNRDMELKTLTSGEEIVLNLKDLELERIIETDSKLQALYDVLKYKFICIDLYLIN